MLSSDKIIIGRRELAALPDFGLEQVKVKVDSGAYTSSIHVTSCFEKADQLHVVFLDNKHPGFTGQEMHFKKFRTKKVKSSNGEVQERYFVFGTMIIAGLSIQTEFSLTVRKGMRYPILLGRKILNKYFLIDTSQKYLYLPSSITA
ncbi:MAG: RimK/LysX family protein [Cryomorphaceae bacterium]|jgi:hypothetical protein|nr:RimK/LysX family protein [Cryomorphaceae bacterium]